MDAVRILHTADVHIGAPFEFLGLKGEEQRAAVREAFARIVKMTGEGEYHLLLIAGDLFDAAYTVGERDLAFVIGTLSGASPRCSTVILPGSHDFWSPGTVYERERGRFEECRGVHLLAPDRTSVVFPALSVAVHGKALTAPSGSESPLAGISPLREVRWNVAVAHGSVEGAFASTAAEDHPIPAGCLEGDFDYYALGHWHSFRVIRGNDPPAVYAGSPEIIARDQRGAGSAVSVTLSQEGTHVEQIRVGRRRVERVTVDCTGLTTTEELVGTVLQRLPADRDLIVELSLSGVIGTEASVDPLLAVAQLDRSYFSVRLAGTQPGREISRERLQRIPAGTVAGTYVRVLLERIDGARGDERDMFEEALQLGYHLFRGRNPLA